ncbi:XRE family transcriptional regulator [Rheinheimera riviphila]|uniref:XRE family transcriptional regulator n=1 Tax=Rheinheimera riviphila TaxID=1834037 RepID=A0A437QT86_9GAMM|nr:helix-turn-helix transcriptional regulator [Rheinheimera riviphila]RVU37706.1 XRE family transcriptional regulator [Rheinheimera riviphila]
MNANDVAELIGQRVRQYRLNQDLSQEALAQLASISLKAVKNAEGGKSTLSTYSALMLALGRIDYLLAAFPDDGISPVQLLHSSTQQKKRASGKTTAVISSKQELDW